MESEALRRDYGLKFRQIRSETAIAAVASCRETAHRVLVVLLVVDGNVILEVDLLQHGLRGVSLDLQVVPEVLSDLEGVVTQRPNVR